MIIALVLFLGMTAIGFVNWYILGLLLQTYPDIERLKHVCYWTGVSIFLFFGVMLIVMGGAAYCHVLKFFFKGKAAIMTIFTLLAIPVIGGLDLAIYFRIKDLGQTITQAESNGDTSRNPDVKRALTFAAIAALIGTIIFFAIIIYYPLKLARKGSQNKQISNLKAEQIKSDDVEAQILATLSKNQKYNELKDIAAQAGIPIS